MAFMPQDCMLDRLNVFLCELQLTCAPISKHNNVSLNTRIRLLLPFFSGEPMTASASRLSDQEDIEVFVYTFGLLFAGLM